MVVIAPTSIVLVGGANGELVVEMGAARLQRYLRKTRNLAWQPDDTEVLKALDVLGAAFTSIRLRTGWDVAEVLQVVGCRQQSTVLDKSHLEVAQRHMHRLGDGVADLFLILEEAPLVDVAFRNPPGVADAPLRTMADEPWTLIFSDAKSFAADCVYGLDTTPRVDSPTRAALLEVKKRFAS